MAPPKLVDHGDPTAGSCRLLPDRKRTWFSRAIALTGLAFLGALNYQLRLPPTVDSTILNYADGREVEMTAHVVEPDSSYSRPLLNNAYAQDRHILGIETESVRDGEESATLKCQLRLNVYGKENSVPELEYGRRFRWPSTATKSARPCFTAKPPRPPRRC